jgi:hypothetical protein
MLLGKLGQYPREPYHDWLLQFGGRPKNDKCVRQDGVWGEETALAWELSAVCIICAV